MTTTLTKADRLAIGAAVAAPVRQGADRPRKVTVVDKDGRPVRETTHTEVAKAVLARSEIEFSVQEGKRPEFVNCKTCGRPVKVSNFGVLPGACRPGTHRCAGCGGYVKSKASVCAFGKMCKKCRAGQHMREVARGRRGVDDSDVRRVLVPEITYQQAADALGVSLGVVYSAARRLGIGRDRKRGVPRGSKWGERRRRAAREPS